MKYLRLFIKILIIILLIQLLYGCTVNESTSLLTIYNNSDKEIKNIKIGGTSIVSYLASGQKYDYYFYSPLEGELTAEGAESGYYKYGVFVEREGTYLLDLGYTFICKINEANSDTFIYITYDEYDGNAKESDEYSYDFYKDK
jgi:hypothetical protein